MTNFEFVVQHMLESANRLDSKGRIVEASSIDQHVQKIVTAGYGGGAAEYIGKLLELARNKGIDYMQSRMQESRIVTLNDGTPIIKENDDKGFISAVVARARALKLPETKGLNPIAPGKIDEKWTNEFASRMEDVSSGKSSWLDQAVPFSEALKNKKLKKVKWNPATQKSNFNSPTPAPSTDKSVNEIKSNAGVTSKSKPRNQSKSKDAIFSPIAQNNPGAGNQSIKSE